MLAEINVVPYIDVMLVLLVIFMITAPMLQQGVEVTPPSAASSPLEGQEDEPLIISINERGEYFVNISQNPEAPVSLRQITELVAAARQVDPQGLVLVNGDKAASYDQVMQAMVAAQHGGAERIGLVTEDIERPQGG
ncbi:MAG TPA: protein TolR [Halothiobacillaceae bacterium]|mgnify:CR=1 FL=1|nr:protein TolR [Halothiobacillaceae bacterium]